MTSVNKNSCTNTTILQEVLMNGTHMVVGQSSVSLVQKNHCYGESVRSSSLVACLKIDVFIWVFRPNCLYISFFGYRSIISMIMFKNVRPTVPQILMKPK